VPTVLKSTDLHRDMRSNRMSRFCLNEGKYPYPLNQATLHFLVGETLKWKKDTTECQKRAFGNVIRLRTSVNQKI
jgi:hypothetical protein